MSLIAERAALSFTLPLEPIVAVICVSSHAPFFPGTMTGLASSQPVSNLIATA
jgi:hypothetical protein